MQSRIDYTLFEGADTPELRVVNLSPCTHEIRRRGFFAGGVVATVSDGHTATLFASAPILLEEHKALMEENERLREALGILLAHYEGMDDIWTDADMAAIGPARAALQDKSSGV